MISDSKNPEFSNSGAFWAPESDEILENDDEQLWFDPWEGQIELSVHKDLSPEKTILNDEILLEENLQNLETSRRNSLLLCRQTSLPGSLFSTSNNSPGKFDNFHSTHTLFWNQRHDSSEDVQMLQEQVGHLAESQATTDDRYSKVKQENATLTQKVHMLEEHIREIELQSQERLIEEQKRHKELLQRLEREKVLELENLAIKLQSAERENATVQRDLTSLRSQVDRLKTEKSQLEQELFESQQSYTLLQSEYAKNEENLKKATEIIEKDRSDNAQIVEELSKEVDTLREQLRRTTAEDVIRNDPPVISDVHGNDVIQDRPISREKEMEAELKNLREETRKLKEEKEDLQAQVINGGVIAGRNVLQTAASISIADELGSLSDNQEFPQLPSIEEYKEVRNALKEQQDVNAQLRGYIDGILTNIIEKYPELLEVKK